MAKAVKKELTVREILELIDAIEKGKKNMKKASTEAKKLAAVFEMPLDELLKSSKLDLVKQAKEYASDIEVLSPKKDKEKTDSLLEQITKDAPVDLKKKDKDYEIDDDYNNPDKVYQDKQYNLQGDEERKSEFSYYDQEQRKKKTKKRQFV